MNKSKISFAIKSRVLSRPASGTPSAAEEDTEDAATPTPPQPAPLQQPIIGAIPSRKILATKALKGVDKAVKPVTKRTAADSKEGENNALQNLISIYEDSGDDSSVPRDEETSPVKPYLSPAERAFEAKKKIEEKFKKLPRDSQNEKSQRQGSRDNSPVEKKSGSPRSRKRISRFDQSDDSKRSSDRSRVKNRIL